MLVNALFAGKPQPFSPSQSPSSIIKYRFEQLHIKFDGAVEGEQGQKSYNVALKWPSINIPKKAK